MNMSMEVNIQEIERLKHEKQNKTARTLLDDSEVVIYDTLKKFNVKKVAQQRMCIVHDGTFYYFKDDTSRKPQGFFTLRGYQAYVTEQVRRSNVVVVDEISSPHTHTTHTLVPK